MRSVPTIDLSAYRADEFEADHFETLALACKDMGFFLLKGHGLDELISEVFAESKSFFSEEKEIFLLFMATALFRIITFCYVLVKQQRAKMTMSSRINRNETSSEVG